MTRDEAIEILSRHDLAQLGPEARGDLLLDWWSMGPEDAEYENLPDQLKAKLTELEEPDDPASSVYDPLLKIALRNSFVGVINEYLERRLSDLGRNLKVEGIVELLCACPCCGYRTLRERGGYEICSVCFWEDDGSNDPNRVSGPNHMTLGEARANFARLGAKAERATRNVLPDGTERYARDNR